MDPTLFYTPALLPIPLSKVAITLPIQLYFGERVLQGCIWQIVCLNVSRLPKLQRNMTIFKYTNAQLYRMDQTCKLMLAAEDWQRLKELGIRAAVPDCRASNKRQTAINKPHSNQGDTKTIS